MKIAVTGGGSGGHLNAATAVIQVLKQKHQALFADLVYIGGERGMIGDPTPSIESRKVPELGVRFIGIRSGKFHRKLNLATLKLLWGVVGGFIDAFKVLRRERPQLLFSTGGYVTVPLVIVARLLGIRTIIHEQTITSGLANRIASKFADVVLISFPNSLKDFPAHKTILTGNPIQESRFRVELPFELPTEYKQHLISFAKRERGKPFIFVTGGGLGSHVINMWVLEHALKLCRQYNILIQTGENKYHNDYQKFMDLRAGNPELRDSLFAVKWFGEEIGFIYSQADLVIGRPGANTVLELLATNRKAILIPIPWASGNEQLLNARYFMKNQSGMIVEQKNLETNLLNAVEAVLEMNTKDSSVLIEREAAQKITKILLENH